MLTADQQDQLLLSLFATAEAMGLQLTQAAALIMVDDLKEHSEESLAQALKACRRSGGRLTVDAILKNLHSADGRPEANEAWAIALQSYDEAETVLMTPEIQQAAAAAAPIAAGRDKVGARMAFIAAYERLVADARRSAQPVTWQVSLGYSQERRSLAIQEAARLGRISSDSATALLQQHTLAAISTDGQAIAGLLTGNGPVPSADLRGKWQAVKNDIERARRRREVLHRWELRRERMALAAKKSVQAAAIQQRIAEEEANG